MMNNPIGRLGTLSQIGHHLSQVSPRQQFSNISKVLYTNGKAVASSAKAASQGLADQIKRRQQKRDEGNNEFKVTVDRNHKSPGLGARILQNLGHTRQQISHGARSAFARVHEGTDELLHGESLRKKRDAALKDERLQMYSLTDQDLSNCDAVKGFFEDNFEVLSSPSFRKHDKAKENDRTFGSLLSLSVLQRIQDNMQVTDQDLKDLSRALYPLDDSVNAPHETDELKGKLTDDKLKQLCNWVFERFSSDATARIDSQYPEGKISARRF